MSPESPQQQGIPDCKAQSFRWVPIPHWPHWEGLGVRSTSPWLGLGVVDSFDAGDRVELLF